MTDPVSGQPDEQGGAVGAGQVWRNRKTGRLIRIVVYNARWDDLDYEAVDGPRPGRRGSIYGYNLRRMYERAEAAS